MPTGAILAGGRSTRFGDADKAVAELAGTPMVRRVANRLTGADDPVGPGAARAAGGVPIVDELVISCRRDQQAAIHRAMAGISLPVRYAIDGTPNRGPVAGIRNVCRAASEPLVAIVACDMPFVDPAFLAFLFERAADHDAAVPQLEDEWFQTTQAVYRAAAMADACDEALAAGERKIITPLFELDYEILTHAEILRETTPRTFENCNTQAELAAAERLVRAERA